MKFEIKNRWSGKVLFTWEGDSIKLAVEAAHTAKVSLRDADLSGADLRGADLSGADLRDAVLRGADLSDADLSGADLRDADLSGADLRGADLSGADLRDAVLRGAVLRGAVLRDAVLRGAVLRGADLRGAVLRDAVLRGAVLSDAVLRGADLSDAVLRGAVLRGAVLTPIRDDLWAVLSATPAEVEGLRAALVEGRVDGSTYSGSCACLVGTLANVRHVRYDEIPNLSPCASRPIERFFTGIKKGDTPETNSLSKLAVEWVDIWLANVKGAFAPAVK